MINSNLPAALAAIEAQLRLKNEAAAIVVEGAAKTRCPVDSGRLRASQSHDSDASGFIVGTNITYAPFVHNGTRYQAPNPWLVNALQESIGELQRIYSA